MLGVTLVLVLLGAASGFRLGPRPAVRARSSPLRMLASRPSTPDELAGMKVAELKLELSRRGLPVSGKKAELIARIAEQMEPAPRPPTRRAPSAGVATKKKRAAAAKTVGTGPALLIVESPAKCATIAKFAGKGFTVLPCNGHVRQLPSKTGSVRPEDDFEMVFETVKGAPKILQTISAGLKEARAMYLATDPDREGEAIAWHVLESLRLKRALPDQLPVHRVSFSEITERAVSAALRAPQQIDMQLVRAQQARQAVDYLVGFTLSPVLWRKLPGCRSAGRVQSVALRLVVEREHEVLRH